MSLAFERPVVAGVYTRGCHLRLYDDGDVLFHHGHLERKEHGVSVSRIAKKMAPAEKIELASALFVLLRMCFS